MASYKQVWETLSAIDCSAYTKKKNDLSYLSWTWAWAQLMEQYPDATYEFQDNEVHGDGTVSVHCTINIGELQRSMWLPVMTGFKNAALANPSARDVGDAKMRCLVKCMAFFGLGHYIYAGEDLPREVKSKPKKKEDVFDSADQVVESSTLEEAVEKTMTGAMTDGDAKKFTEVALGFARQTDTVEGLKSLHTANKKTLDEIKLSHPDVYEAYVNEFKSIRSKVQS